MLKGNIIKGRYEGRGGGGGTTTAPPPSDIWLTRSYLPMGGKGAALGDRRP